MLMLLDLWGRIIAGKNPERPFQLLTAGDLLSLIQMIIIARGTDFTAISKVKGHADEGLVRRGQVRLADKIGNDLADTLSSQEGTAEHAWWCWRRKCAAGGPQTQCTSWRSWPRRRRVTSHVS